MKKLQQKLLALGLILSFASANIAFAATPAPIKTAPAVNTETTQAADVDVAARLAQMPERIVKIEHLPTIKNVSSNLVTVTNYRSIINKGDVFNVTFTENFTTKNLKVGDKILFKLPNGLYTQEGRLLLPACTEIIACVSEYTPPKWLNKNAKVMFKFNEILVPQSSECPMDAAVFSKDNTLHRSGWATFAKPAAWTVGMFGVGAGLGAAFGAAASSASTGCLAIGMPVGGGVGLLIGLVTPGLHYKAKAGKAIPIILNQDLTINNIADPNSTK